MERYQISLHAVDLPRQGIFRTRPNPYARVKVVSGSKNGEVLGETEFIPNCKNADWAKLFFLEFDQAEVTTLEVSIYSKAEGPGSHNDTFIAKASFEATAVFQEPGRTASEQIGSRDSSKLFMHIEKSRIGDSKGTFNVRLRGLDMKNVEPGVFGLGRSDPFYEISKKDSDYSVAHVKWNVVYRSETIHNHLNPLWKGTSVGLDELCYGQLDWPLKVSVYDFNDNGRHQLIGEYETTIPELQSHISFKGNADRDQAIQLGREEKNKTYGLLCVLDATLLLE